MSRMGVLIAEENKMVNFDYLYDMEPTENGETRQFSGHHLHPVYAEKTVPIKVYQPTMPSDPNRNITTPKKVTPLL